MADQKTAEKTTTVPENGSDPEVSVKEINRQIETLEPIAKAVDRKFTIDGEERVYVQHEMSFFSKIKFFRLMSGTLRLATSEETGGIAELVSEAYLGAQQFGANNAEVANVFLDSILRLVELAPDFLEETYLLALNVKPEESAWVLKALQDIDDELGMDILEVFVAQNGQAISDFFTKRLGKLTKRVSQYIPDQAQADESETTT